MTYLRRLTRALVLLALLLVAVAAPAVGVAQSRVVQPEVPQPGVAQPPGTANKVRTWTDPAIATLMLVETLGHAEARAVVIRRPGEVPNNVILVTRATTPADLANAASALIASRRSRGDQVDREIRALIGAPPVRTVPAPAKQSSAGGSATKRAAGAKPSPSERRAASDLQRLRSAPSFTIEGVGRGPALVIRMSDRKP